MAKSQEMEFPLFDVSLEELKTLMEYSGNEAREKIDNYYGGTEGLCKRLQTDPINDDYYDYDDEEEDELYLAEIIVVAINIVFVIKARIEYNVERKFRGDKIPADGVLIGSCELKVDGASHNGSYDNTKKSVESDPTVFAGTNGRFFGTNFRENC
uniref:Movement protein n=1 Tax=Meloidogyne hapla TaxID=6305 RepID=A0A1I8BBL6_MELHA